MLELQHVSLEVNEDGQEKGILHDINLKIPDGNLTVITGPNGGGKSTLAKIIAGIIRPTAGKILFNGEDITEMSITDRARKGIGFAFQQPVRFKGLQVFDLIRLATGSKLSSVDACKYLSDVFSTTTVLALMASPVNCILGRLSTLSIFVSMTIIVPLMSHSQKVLYALLIVSILQSAFSRHPVACDATSFRRIVL